MKKKKLPFKSQFFIIYYSLIIKYLFIYNINIFFYNLLIISILIINIQDKISTENQIVVQSILTGEAKGYDQQGKKKPKSDSEIHCEQLIQKLNEKTDENTILKNKIAELELKVAQLSKVGPRKSLSSAILTDSIVNGSQ